MDQLDQSDQLEIERRRRRFTARNASRPEMKLPGKFSKNQVFVYFGIDSSSFETVLLRTISERSIRVTRLPPNASLNLPKCYPCYIHYVP